MTILKTALMTGAVTTVLATGWFYREREGRLQEAVRLRAENDQMRLLVSQRHEAWLKQAQRVRGTEYRNEGQDTPLSALQTYAWACDHGDVARMETLIVFDVAARKKADDYFATLPRTVRTQWASLDAMAAAIHISAGMNNPFPGAALLQQARFESSSPDRVVVVMPGTNADRSEFQRTAAGWKLVITEAMVDAHIQQEAQSPGPP